jgi:hypothetical protein
MLMPVHPPPADQADETYSALINTAGRQRMLSQRIVLFTLLAAQGDVGASTTAEQALALFRDSHTALATGGNGLPAPFTDELQAAFFGLRGVDAPVHEFIAMVQHALRAIRSGQISQAGLPALVERTTPLLGQLNTLTLCYETHARRHAVRQREHQEALMEEIQRIAQEARMVSMNARIVAARAGQEGKEFAVVANVLSGISQRIEDLTRAALKLR